MTFMQWTAELELGAGEIDGQHRWLVDQTNALHDELSGQAPRREVIGELQRAAGSAARTASPSARRPSCCSASSSCFSAR